VCASAHSFLFLVFFTVKATARESRLTMRSEKRWALMLM
jgi:hypothetical protein